MIHLALTTERKHDETDGIGGTGLGLYIVKELVELMQGKVWVNSRLDQGTTFSFSIPTEWSESSPRESAVFSATNGGKHD